MVNNYETPWSSLMHKYWKRGLFDAMFPSLDVYPPNQCLVPFSRGLSSFSTLPINLLNLHFCYYPCYCCQRKTVVANRKVECLIRLNPNDHSIATYSHPKRCYSHTISLPIIHLNKPSTISKDITWSILSRELVWILSLRLVAKQKLKNHGLVRFYGISTIVGYLMPNLLYTYIIKYMICKQIL